jgi:hypothetical protein
MTTPFPFVGNNPARINGGGTHMARPLHLVTTSTAIPVLIRWGVSAHADLVYRALSAFGTQPDTMLARSLDLPLKAVRAALDELHGLGAARPVPTGGQPHDRTWLGTPTETVVSTLRERQVLLAKARHHLHRQLSILDIVDDGDGLRTARPIFGVPSTRARLAELVSAERREHLAMNPEAAFTAASAKAGVPASRAALQRGVTAWTLGVPAAVEDQSEAHTKELYNYGLQYRERPFQPIKMMIMDRIAAFLPLNPAVNFSAGVWEVSAPAMVEQLVSFFMQHWSKAIEPRGGSRQPR